MIFFILKKKIENEELRLKQLSMHASLALQQLGGATVSYLESLLCLCRAISTCKLKLSRDSCKVLVRMRLLHIELHFGLGAWLVWVPRVSSC